MAFHDDSDSDRRRKADSEPKGDHRSNRAPRKKRAPAPEVGQALRSAYQDMVDEDIPPEMLDLLGKLG